MRHVKVAYLIVTRSFPGLLKQIEYDRALTRDLEGIDWDHFTFLDTDEGSGHVKALPTMLRGVFGRKLFAWIWMLQNTGRYDFIIVRHMEFDPFAPIFAWFVRNRIPVHHSKEVLELKLVRRGWKGQAASMLERFSGRIAVRTSRALLCVTREICQYQQRYHDLPHNFPIGLFPNGVIVDDIEPLADARVNNIVEIGFMCGSFAAWHGLDILLKKIDDYISRDLFKAPIKLHLIGKLSDDQLRHVAKVNDNARCNIVVPHGRQKESEYRNILNRCHIGIGSLAMGRIRMEEGATLKVRELLAMGLPLYSGHTDTALPSNFPYYFIGNGDIDEIVTFAKKVADVPRYLVREAGRPYIDKRIWLEAASAFLRQVFESSIHEPTQKA
jgi:hypothetical protein